MVSSLYRPSALPRGFKKERSFLGSGYVRRLARARATAIGGELTNFKKVSDVISAEAGIFRATNYKVQQFDFTILGPPRS